jgi:heme A synthase
MVAIQRILLVAFAAAVLAVTFHLIRKRRLREEYAVLWVVTGLVILVGALVPEGVLAWLSGALHLSYGVLITFVCFVFLAAIVLHYSVAISRHAEREKDLAQELALVRDELERLRAELREKQAPAPEKKPKPPALRT